MLAWNIYTSLFSRGIRYYLCRQLGPQELEDKVHDTFLIVVNAIRRGDLREPERLMGFVRTVVRRQVAAYIENAVHTRREQADLESGVAVADKTLNPEQEAIGRAEGAVDEERSRGAFANAIATFWCGSILRSSRRSRSAGIWILTETQFRLLKSRAKAKFGEIGRKKLASSGIFSVFVRAASGRGVHFDSREGESLTHVYDKTYFDHPNEEALERFLLQRSDENELEVLETHILACEVCITRLETLELQITNLKAALVTAEEQRIQKELHSARSSWKSWFRVPLLIVGWGGLRCVSRRFSRGTALYAA